MTINLIPALVTNDELAWSDFISRIQNKNYQTQFLYDRDLDCWDCYLWFEKHNLQNTPSIVHYLDEKVALLISEDKEILGFHLEDYHRWFQGENSVNGLTWRLSQLPEFNFKKLTKGCDLWLVPTTVKPLSWLVIVPTI